MAGTEDWKKVDAEDKIVNQIYQSILSCVQVTFLWNIKSIIIIIIFIFQSRITGIYH